jgi:3-dehydroquinate dehydratase / shikimate dehydrogenase
MICISIGNPRHKMMIAEHRALAEQGAELVEMRLDWLSRLPKLHRLLNDRPTPIVITCRRKSDGGRWAGTEDQRMTLLRAAIVDQADYVDLEDDVADKIPRYGDSKRIISHHNFDETPEDLEDIHARMMEVDPDIIKLVTMAKSPCDFIRLLKLADSATVPTIAFCMGPLGVASRILCGKYGAPFTYATAKRQRQVAPGQLSFQEMKELYRYDAIDNETQVYGVLGDSAVNDPMVEFQNTFFGQLDSNSVCVPLQLTADDLESAWPEFEWLGLSGVTVACTHQSRVLEVITATDDAVQDAGAANTLYRDSEGSWRAANALATTLISSLQQGIAASDDQEADVDDVANLNGKKALILGAGKLARTVGVVLKRAGVAVTFSNRTHDRAIALAEELGCEQTPWNDRDLVEPSILINCTPIGGPEDKDDTPFMAKFLESNVLVADFADPVRQTRLLQDCRSAGCSALPSFDLLVRRVSRQLEHLTGQPVAHADIADDLRATLSGE